MSLGENMTGEAAEKPQVIFKLNTELSLDLPPLHLLYNSSLKGVFAKNERGYRLNAIKKALLIAINLTSICCVYKEKIDKDVSYRRA